MEQASDTDDEAADYDEHDACFDRGADKAEWKFIPVCAAIM
jgi:hypothetical protein